MKKFGFTLTEILISLTVVGIVASLTIPNFVSEGKNKMNASRISSTINAAETAFASMISGDSVADLLETEFYVSFDESPTADKTKSKFGEYYKYNTSGTVNNFYKSATIFKHIGTSTGTSPEAEAVFQTKNGALLLLSVDDNSVISEDEALSLGIAPVTGAFKLVIDVNGGQSPNTHGRDVFTFLVDSNGRLHPAGGTVYNEAVKEETCQTGSSIGCTARLIENNFVMDY